MKPLTFVLCVTVSLTQFAWGTSFRFDEPLGSHPALMYLNFAEACFLEVGKKYEPSSNMRNCVSEGGNFAPYVDAPISSLADRCSQLNVLKHLYAGADGGAVFTFRKSFGALDGETIASARTACAELARLFSDMPFNNYAKTTKECRKMVGTSDDCIRLLRTATGVVVGFFFFEAANDLQSQCETLKAVQTPPPNLICSLPRPRVGPDLRFRAETDLSLCPPLAPVADPATCSDHERPEAESESPHSEPTKLASSGEAPPDTNTEAKP